MPSFIVKEEEELVLDDWSPDRTAVPVVHQRRPGESQPIVVPGIGVQRRILMVFVKRTVKRIGPALSHERGLSSRRAPERCIWIGNGDAQLIERFRGHGNRRSKGQADNVVGYVDAVEDECVLVGARACHFAAGRYTGLQGQQTRGLTVGIRQPGDSIAVDDHTD